MIRRNLRPSFGRSVGLWRAHFYASLALNAMLREDGGFTAQIELLWVSSGEVRDGANLVFELSSRLALRVQLRNATMCQKTTIGRSEFRRIDKSTFLDLVKQMYCFG